MVRSEKQVLRFYTELLAAARPLLEMPPRQRNREIRHLGAGNDITRFLETINSDLMDMGQ